MKSIRVHWEILVKHFTEPRSKIWCRSKSQLTSRWSSLIYSRNALQTWQAFPVISWIRPTTNITDRALHHSAFSQLWDATRVESSWVSESTPYSLDSSTRKFFLYLGSNCTLTKCMYRDTKCYYFDRMLALAKSRGHICFFSAFSPYSSTVTVLFRRRTSFLSLWALHGVCIWFTVFFRDYSIVTYSCRKFLSNRLSPHATSSALVSAAAGVSKARVSLFREPMSVVQVSL